MKLEAAKRLTSAKVGSITPEDAGKILKQVEKIFGEGKVIKAKKADSVQRVEWDVKSKTLRSSATLTYNPKDRSIVLSVDSEVRYADGDDGYISIEAYGYSISEFKKKLAQECKDDMKELQLYLEDLKSELDGVQRNESILMNLQALSK